VRPVAPVPSLWRRFKTGIRLLGLSMGVILMMTANASGAPAFKLKAPKEYFSDAHTLALLNAAMWGIWPKLGNS